MADESQINSFLQDVKNADYIDFVPTEKNRQTRLSIGMTAPEQEEIVRKLKIKEYYSGPFKDKDLARTGMVWIFKHYCKKNLLYIKLKEKIIVEGITVIKCLSCHIDHM